MKVNKKILLLVIAGIVAVAVAVARFSDRDDGTVEGFVSGNGRIEATELNATAKYAGRIEAVLVREGEFVTAGQPVVRMQVETLQAQLEEARAGTAQAASGVANAQAQVAVRESDLVAARALIAQYEAQLDAARRRLARSQSLAKGGAASVQELEDDRARVRSAEATLAASRAQAVAAEAAVTAARTQVTGADAAVAAAHATVTRIEAELRDSVLTSPRDARVQYIVAREGEVVGAGSPVLNLVDIGDVYMTFFVPSAYAGRVALGAPVRIVLDIAPDHPVAARISFVAATAQFTPKTVETASEREKLMFRVRAHIDRSLLERHQTQVKAGLPGVAWIQLDPERPWPERLQRGLVE